MLTTVENGRAIDDPRRDPTIPTTARRPLHEGRALPRAHVLATERVLHPMRRVGRKGEGRFERISWDEALDEIAARFADIAALGRRSAGDPAVQLRRHHGPAAVRVDGPALLPSPRRVAARPHDLRVGRQGRLDGGDRRVGRHGRRAVREQQAHPDLGQQSGRVEPALLDAGAGSEAARREARRDRSVPQRHRREVPRAHRADAGHRRRARARRHARADRARA